MNDEMPTSASTIDDTAEAAGAESATDPTSAASAVQNMANDLKALGQQFGAVLKAAASTPEAEQLSGQIRDGLSSLRDEIDDALSGVRGGARKVAGDQAGNVLNRAQIELANALHLLSRGIDRVATGVTPAPDIAAPDDTAPSSDNGSVGDTPA